MYIYIILWLIRDSCFLATKIFTWKVKPLSIYTDNLSFPVFFFLKRIKILVLTSMQGATSFSYHLPAQIIKTGVRNAAKEAKMNFY